MPATMDVKTLGPHLTAEQAEQIYSAGKEAVIFALFQLAEMPAEQQQISRPTQSPAPSTPWRMIPPYQKPSAHFKTGQPPPLPETNNTSDG